MCCEWSALALPPPPNASPCMELQSSLKITPCPCLNIHILQVLNHRRPPTTLIHLNGTTSNIWRRMADLKVRTSSSLWLIFCSRSFLSSTRSKHTIHQILYPRILVSSHSTWSTMSSMETRIWTWRPSMSVSTIVSRVSSRPPVLNASGCRGRLPLP